MKKKSYFAGARPSKRDLSASDDDFYSIVPERKRARNMTGWYDPLQLATTAYKVLVSEMLRERADMRVIESVTAEQPKYDYSSASGALWIDYAADAGDGFNSTYAVARALAEPELQPQDSEQELRRGHILLMGGDQVYPTASRRAYHDRLVLPYEHAFPAPTPKDGPTAAPRTAQDLASDLETARMPQLYAIPGNHDWYDGLPAFLRLFCNGRTHGGLRTLQKRSYFTLRLPHRWWLVATDIQLAADVDQPQLDYMLEALGGSDGMKPGDQVILCLAEPAWVHDTLSKASKKRDLPFRLSNNLGFLERKIRDRYGGVVKLWLAGDLHHYRHHQCTDEGNEDWHKVVCGGGGAFTLGTHHLDATIASPSNGKVVDYKETKAYPDRDQSKKLTWRAWLFNYYNPRFGIVTGIVYAMFGWLIMRNLRSVDVEVGNLWAAVSETVKYLVTQRPSGLILAVVLLAGTAMFTKSKSNLYRFIVGPLHGVVHLLAAIYVTWVAGAVIADLALAPLPSTLLALAALLAAGAIVGPFILGAYLFISFRGFGQHANELFSSIKNADYKSFLRLRLDENGLTVHPIGIDRTPKYKPRFGAPDYELPTPDTRMIEPAFTIPNPAEPMPANRAQYPDAQRMA